MIDRCRFSEASTLNGSRHGAARRTRCPCLVRASSIKHVPPHAKTAQARAEARTTRPRMNRQFLNSENPSSSPDTGVPVPRTLYVSGPLCLRLTGRDHVRQSIAHESLFAAQFRPELTITWAGIRRMSVNFGRLEANFGPVLTNVDHPSQIWVLPDLAGRFVEATSTVQPKCGQEPHLCEPRGASENP